jgi:ATP-dependent Clp protease protease subunit
MNGKEFFKVVTQKGSDRAEILLYGYIGQELWWDEDRKDENITDMEFERTIRDLEKSYSRIDIRINGPGGSMYHGNAIINSILRSQAEIHTYIDGMAASMSADIWFASKNRHMAKNSLLMLHAPSTIEYGNANDFRKTADVLDKFSSTVVAVMAENTGIAEEEIMEKYYDGEDHWFTAQDAIDAGFIEKVEPYEAEMPVEDPQKMAYEDLIHAYQHTVKHENTVMSRLRKALGINIHKNISQGKKEDMNIENIKKAIAEGDITEEQITELLVESGYTVEKEAQNDQQAPPADVDVNDVVEKAVAPLLEQIQKLQDEIEKLGSEPGAQKTAVAKPNDDGSQSEAMRKLNEELAEMSTAASKWHNPYVK